jgi:anhydro-N-acetylmuramic acid kinase
MNSLPSNNANEYKVIGLMSGTSLDGLDMAFCHFEKIENTWKYEILKAQTIAYSPEWQERLRSGEKGNALDLTLTDHDYGQFLGKLTKSFLDEHRLDPDFIASHGHTIFHQPGSGITLQIGKGSEIAAVTGLPVICDFRSLDVALGGQGAPLVPIGDRLLFPEFDYCLNLGGIANISNENCGRRIAFDICPANMVLNFLANQVDKPFDVNGDMARQGKLNVQLLEWLNDLDYYKENPPKSLGKEWVFREFIPVLEESDISVEDKLMTVSEHIAYQVSASTEPIRNRKMLVTGGGAFNTFLLEKIREKCRSEIIIPDRETVNFKEALIFAFLGVLRWRNEVNILRSYTGASHDNPGGTVYLPARIY